jgi:hypothetical protein
MAATLHGTFQRPDVNPSAFTDVLGAATDTGRIGVIGSNPGVNAFGFLAGFGPRVE